MKSTPQARYKRAKVETRRVDFYPTDAKILAFSREINFAAFVKEKLKEAMKEKSNEREEKNTMTIKTEQSLGYFAIPFNSVPEALMWATAHKLYNITVKILSDGTPAIILDKNNENHRKAWNTYVEKKN